MTGSARATQTEQGTTTLGDVVFSKRTSCVPESEWVALVRATAAGDAQALHALFARTHKIVFTLVMRITRNRQTAEELTLDVSTTRSPWRSRRRWTVPPPA